MSDPLRITEVSLAVADLETTTAFYRDALGLPQRSEGDGVTELEIGAGARLRLVERPEGAPYPGRPGLYHLAILLPSRAALASAMHRLFASRTPIAGAADHLVSEAVYLEDPEGNGVELACDRPPERWPRRDGRLSMDTRALDLAGLMREASGPASTLPDAAIIGHVHLKVNDVEAAQAYYVEGLGFELMQRYGPSACFFAVDGYHHHIGVNSWASAGAPKRPDDALGLLSVTLERGLEEEVKEIATRLGRLGYGVTHGREGLATEDPAGNRLLIRPRRDGPVVPVEPGSR